MLPGPTMQKLLSDSFPEDAINENPSLSIPLAGQKRWFEQLLKRMGENSRTSWRIVEGRDPEIPIYLTLKLVGVQEKRSPDDWFTLRFQTIDNRFGLFILDSSFRRRAKLPPAQVRSIEQIEQFIATVQARQDRDHLQSKRSEKLVGFQKQGLTARLRALGNQHNFAFAVNENVRDIKLSIRIAGRKTGYHFSFVKTRLEVMLEQLPDLVAMLQKMQTLGIHFADAKRAIRKAPQNLIDWIEPEKEQSP